MSLPIHAVSGVSHRVRSVSRSASRVSMSSGGGGSRRGSFSTGGGGGAAADTASNEGGDGLVNTSVVTDGNHAVDIGEDEDALHSK